MEIIWFYGGLFVAVTVVLCIIAAVNYYLAPRIFVRHTELAKQLAEFQGKINTQIENDEEETKDRITQNLKLISDQKKQFTEVENKVREK